MFFPEGQIHAQLYGALVDMRKSVACRHWPRTPWARIAEPLRVVGAADRAAVVAAAASQARVISGGAAAR
jgi:hypothetical protein